MLPWLTLNAVRRGNPDFHTMGNFCVKIDIATDRKGVEAS
jgi:hypothetical protein